MNAPLHHNRDQFRDTVREALLDHAEDLFSDLIGKPERAGGHDWRSRARRGFSMEMRGPRRGLWKNHTTGEKGDLLDLVALELLNLSKPYGQDFTKVLNAAAAWAGVTRDTPVDRTAQIARQSARDRDAKAQDQQQARQRATLTQKIASKAQPIMGSPAAAYLAGRGIVDLPRTGIAYLPAAPDLAGPGMASPKHPALTVWAYGVDGTLKGGQRILIDTAGRKASLPEDANRKPAFAAIGGNPARFPARIDGGPLCVCEGPESALSVWQATGFETWAVFGVSGWESAPLPHGRKIILCPDRDAPVGTYPAGSKKANSKESAARTFGKAVRAQLGKGVQVWIAEAPEPVGSKSDLNDTLQRAGNQAVAQAIAAAVDMTQRITLPPAAKLESYRTADMQKELRDAAPKDTLAIAVAVAYALRASVPVVQSIEGVMAFLESHTCGRLAQPELDAIESRVVWLQDKRRKKITDRTALPPGAYRRHHIRTVGCLSGIAPDQFKGVVLVKAPMGEGKTQRVGRPFVQHAKSAGGGGRRDSAPRVAYFRVIAAFRPAQLSDL